MYNYNAIKMYKDDDGKYILELLIEVSDVNELDGSSETYIFDTKEEQLIQAKKLLEEL